MTPFGHASVSFLAGACFFRKSYRDTASVALILGGILPDMDFLFFLFDWFNRVHRVISHNLLFIASAALIGSLLSWKGNKKIVAFSLFAGGLLHLAIDSCLDNNPSNGIGIALYWPFSDTRFSPFNLLNVNEAGIVWNQPILKMVRLMMPLFLYETPLYFLSALLFFRQRQHRQNHA